MKQKIKVFYEGWFLFCPIWAETDLEISPIPKYNMWWLLDMAFDFQQLINWFMSFIAPEACGFMMYIRDLKEPREIEVRI